MTFENETINLRLLDVLYWQDENSDGRTNSRQFDALSLRIKSDAQFDTGNQIIKMHDGELAYVPAGCSYTRTCTVDKMIVFHFIPDIPSDDIQIRAIRDCDYNLIYPMFHKALMEWTEKKEGYYYRTIALLYNIIGELCKQPDDDANNLNPVTVRAVSIIKREFLNSACSVSGIAQQLNVSEAYLRRVFRQDMGQSPKQYMNSLRMNLARDLLNAGYDSISVISDKIGFSDPKNFATAYKKHFGYPPSMQSYMLADVIFCK